MATSAPVLYANTHHPELKSEFPNWSDRHKQIIKRWRGLSVEVKTPFNQKARENRTTLRMKKTQQVRRNCNRFYIILFKRGSAGTYFDNIGLCLMDILINYKDNKTSLHHTF